jgi:L,D-transpeptidase ErfK/SrfK
MEKSRMTGHRKDSPGARLLLGLLAILSTGGASAQTYELPPTGEDVIGQVSVVRAHHQDTLSDIASAYHLGYEEILHANPGVDPWLP